MGSETETTPLLPPLVKDDEATAQLRDRVTTQYTTIALVSALLSAVSFAAYATPPSALFSAAASSGPPSALGAAPPPLPPGMAGLPPPGPPHGFEGLVAEGAKHVESLFTMENVDWVVALFMRILWHIYGIVMPLAFVCNLAGTLAASGVILYANSTLASGAAVRRLFGDKLTEHAIIRYPAAFLVLGVMCLFSGFCIGICLFYGIGVAFITGGSAMVAFFIYERFYAHGTHSETFNALSVSVGALFFRSCLPDMARQADEHPAAAAAAEDADGGHPGAGAEAVDADEEAERGERKRAEWEERAGAIGKAVAEQLRSEPVIVRRDPRDDTRAFAKKGCCK